ncbi:MAG TPA: ATP-binding protein [Thermoplasmata archaeon]|jgi:MinD superfamily P-loop ATPase
MKQVVILSGKGGTGKTILAASYASLARGAVIADCDVDAPNLHLLLQPRVLERGSFTASKVAVIDGKACTSCMKCVPLCRFGAIRVIGNEGLQKVALDESRCEGCGVCMRVCPVRAVRLEDRTCGEWFVSETKKGKMVHALLNPGGENSGKLVALVKHKATQIAAHSGAGLVLIDGPPGLGCPVISTLAGADFVVLVAEPTRSGLSDFERIASLVHGFTVRTACVINRYDINVPIAKEIEKRAFEMSMPVLALVPYDDAVVSSMARGKAPVEDDGTGAASCAITVSWRKLVNLLGLNEEV